LGNDQRCSIRQRVYGAAATRSEAPCCTFVFGIG